MGTHLTTPLNFSGRDIHRQYENLDPVKDFFNKFKIHLFYINKF